MNNQNSIGNVLARLHGLKSVSGRRVMPGQEIEEEYENEPMDVQGVGAAPTTSANMPQNDFGGSLTSQSYDVRANTSTSAEPPPMQDNEEGESFWTRFGKSLAYQTHNIPQEKPKSMAPPVATQQVDVSEGLPPVSAEQQEMPETSNSSFWKSITGGLKDIGSAIKEEAGKPYRMSEEDTKRRERINEDIQLRNQGVNPDQYRTEQEEIHKNTQEAIMNKIDEAAKNPMTTAVYGATDIVANQPELNAQFKEYTGIDLSEQEAALTSEYEKILDDLDSQNNLAGEGYTEQEQRIKERILANQATDNDKYYIGLALLMPLLVGAFFGKEAALGALGGSAEGLSKALQNRQKSIQTDEELLAGVGKMKGENEIKRAELALKRVELPEKIRKNLPKDEKEFLKGKRIGPFNDPYTGEVKEGVELKPNLIARPEFVTSKEEMKEMIKEAQEINNAIVPTREVNKLTNDIIDISSKMKDKNIINKLFISYLENKNPTLPSKFSDTVDFQGRKVNGYVVLNHKIKSLVDAYRQIKGMRALTQSVQDHVAGLFNNPLTSFQDFQGTIDQMLFTRELAQDRLLNNVDQSGFYPEFVSKLLQPEVKDVYNKLNKKEGEKEASALLRD